MKGLSLRVFLLVNGIENWVRHQDLVLLLLISCRIVAYQSGAAKRMGRVRKSAVQIRFEILEYLFFNTKAQLRTIIWRKSTNLSYDDFVKHLLYLEEKNLIKEDEEGHCLLTDQGRALYLDLRKSLPSIL